MQPARLTIDHQSDEPIWTSARLELWRRIERHDFEPDTPLNFTRRLARDQGWSLGEARSAVDAYRRFCFLAVVSRTPVTPSEEVDEVWHLHLIHTRDYWTVWCEKILRRCLHHDPTPGGPEARLRFRRQYAETLALHERFFESPDPKWWPATHVRFGGSRRRGLGRPFRHVFRRAGTWILGRSGR